MGDRQIAKICFGEDDPLMDREPWSTIESENAFESSSVNEETEEVHDPLISTGGLQNDKNILVSDGDSFKENESWPGNESDNDYETLTEEEIISGDTPKEDGNETDPLLSSLDLDLENESENESDPLESHLDIEYDESMEETDVDDNNFD